MYKLREKCVLCESKKFISCFDTINTIDIVEDKKIMDTKNEIKNLNFIGCTICGCVQLQNLFDPSQIYNQKSHYSESDVWIKHNNLLSQFIQEKSIINNNHIIEIGGGSGRFANLLISKNKNIKSYKILDISINNIEPNKNIEYIEGNCEFFDYENIKIDTIIMSHMFEHLYEPRNFLKNVRDSKIQEIFISIPDMENLTKNGDINNLHIQHTFYIDTNFITWLFGEFNFELKNIYNYDNNSVFYHFIRNNNLKNKPIDDIKNILLIEDLKNFYSDVKEKIRQFNLKKPFFVCPSGFYGKIIYHYLSSDIKNNIIGFLDSDCFKINKRLSGTKIFIFDKEYVKNYKHVNVLIIAEKYNKEIKEELLKYNNFINFYYL